MILLSMELGAIMKVGEVFLGRKKKRTQSCEEL